MRSKMDMDRIPEGFCGISGVRLLCATVLVSKATTAGLVTSFLVDISPVGFGPFYLWYICNVD
jgi:hypothetical protein